MKHSRFFDQVEKHFDYLVDEYEFVVVSRETYPPFDNAEVVLQSKECRIRVVRDRGEVYVSAAPLPPSEECWFDLGIIIDYLTQGGDNSWDFKIPRQDDYDTRIEWQIRKLAAILRVYCARICELFSKDVFAKTCAELKEFMAQRFTARWGQHTSKG